MSATKTLVGWRSSRTEDIHESEPIWFRCIEAIHKLEGARPFTCCLSSTDYTRLHRVLRNQEGDPLYRWLLRSTLADAEVRWPRDIPCNVATGGSRITFELPGRRISRTRLIHEDASDADPEHLTIRSSLGLTLLGMRTGQSAPFVFANGEGGEVRLLGIRTPGDGDLA